MTRQIDENAFDIDVPVEVFDAMMKRASDHVGYVPGNEEVYTAYHARDTVFQCNANNAASSKVVRQRILSWRQLPGASVLACMYERRSIPFSEFSCSFDCMTDVRNVRRLALRVNAHTRLVFEQYVDQSRRIVRRVFVDISVSPKTMSDDDFATMQRTVQNTVQAVFMAVPLKHGPKIK